MLAVWSAPAFGEPVRFEGHKQIRVQLRTQTDWETVQSVTDDLWYPDMLSLDATWGVDVWAGRVEFRVTPDQFQRLEQSGLPFEVLDADIQATLDANRQAGAGGDPYNSWLTYDEVLTYLDNLAASRPELTEIFTIGQTLEGRDITGIKITGPGEDKPGVLYHGCEHAREWLTVPVTLYTAEQLLTNYDDDPIIRDLVDRVEWYIIPVFNADGYIYTWTDNRMWRKNRRGGYGVDINRNWGHEWGGEGSSGNQSSDTYRGSGPFSEPETQRMRDFFLSHPNIVAHNDIHSYGEWALWPWGYTADPIPDNEEFWQVGDTMVDTIQSVHGERYTPGPVYTTLYPASGVSIDWVYNEFGILTYTFELRGPGFDPPTSEITPTCEEIFPALVFLTQYATSAVQIAFPEGRPDHFEPNTEYVVPVEISARTEDVDTAGAVLHYRIGGAGEFTAIPLEHVGGDSFEANFPARGCGEDTEYYVEARGMNGGVVYSPLGAPEDVYSAPVGVLEITLADNFETDNGSTAINLGATAGDWQRGVPTNDPRWEYGPTEDGDGSGQAWLTENDNNPNYDDPWNTDVDNGAVQLVSYVFDMSAGGNISYDYYLRLTNDGGNDRLLVEINSDAGDGAWIEIARHTQDGGRDWRRHVITEGTLEDLGVAFTERMQLRFTANDAERQSIVEAGVDGLEVSTFTCEEGGCIREPAWQCDGDVDGDGQVNPVDSGIVQSAFGSGDDQDLCNYDLDCDGQINPVDAGIVQSLFGVCEPVREVCP